MDCAQLRQPTGSVRDRLKGELRYIAALAGETL